MRKARIVFRQRIAMSLLIGVLMLLGVAPTAFAQFTPAISASDQAAIDGTITVKIASANGPSWVVIHADDEGNPGPVIGQVAIAKGVSKNVNVPIDTEKATETLHVMLHDDLGTEGEYEFPGADVPTKVNDKVVMVPIQMTGEETSIIGTAKKAGTFTTLLAAIEAAGLTTTLMNEGPLTVFAPTDEAFAQIPQAQLDALLADQESLVKVLTYHVVPGAVASQDIADGMTATTVQGEDLTFAVSPGEITVNGAVIGPADIDAGNGIIHIVDQVLLPPSMAPIEEAAAETPAVAASEAVTATKEAAASEAMTETAEVAASEAVTATEETAASEAMTETTEVAASEAMTATEAMTDTASGAASEPAMAEGSGDIVETAVAGEFTTLVAAIEAASLVEALKGEGPFTVFAPSEEAFAKIPADTLNGLLADPEGLLTQILLYHVVPNKVLSTDMTDGMEIETLQGSKLRVSVSGGAVLVDGARVVAVDIPASNGVIHVVDTVLIPASESSGASETPASAEAPVSGESAAAPTEVPQTGASDDPAMILFVVAVVLGGLVLGTIVSRRRTA